MRNHCVVCCEGIKQQQAKGVRHTTKSPLIHNDRMDAWLQILLHTMQINIFVWFFLWNILQKKWGYVEGILRQVLEVLTDESLCWIINILIVLYVVIQKKKYKKLCFFFFIYLLIKKRKNKKNFTKKSKKKTWNFIFYLYIEHDHSGWSSTIMIWKTIEILFTYIQKDTRSPDLIVCLFIYEKYWNDKRKKKIWYFETWQF